VPLRLEPLLRRDRAIVLGALAVLILLAWIYLAWSAHPIGGAEPGGRHAMEDMAGGAAGQHPGSGPGAWPGTDILLLFLMWIVMMVGMMMPSVAPMLLIYARVARHAEARGHAFAPTAWFAAGYLLAWTGFAVAATLVQGLLHQAALLTPAMASSHRMLGAALLAAAGLYQWSPFKESCLGYCRSPLLFIQDHGGFRGDRRGALRLGMKHGAYCVGCCWVLMLLLFVGGVMNFLWIAVLAAMVLAEKVLPAGRVLSRCTGVALILAGIALAAGYWR
jgi:predicted metal-binding membrane protein